MNNATSGNESSSKSYQYKINLIHIYLTYRVHKKTLVHFLYYFAKGVDAIELKISAIRVNIIQRLHAKGAG